MDGQGRTLEQTRSDDGIMSILRGEFESVFRKRAGPWLSAHPGCAVLAGGMVGSRQGWCEAPYVPCPADFAALAGGVAWHKEDGLSVGFVPGLRTESPSGVPDVMRGEEVQIFGAMEELGIDSGLFVLPGTHSKWARVESRRIVHFHTFMTGELYALLRHHSILARSMPSSDAALERHTSESFLAGCLHESGGGLLHNVFAVRTLGLMDKLGPDRQPDFLSGLLIGQEIREALSLLDVGPRPSVYVACEPGLYQRYALALGTLGVGCTRCPPDTGFAGLFTLARFIGLLA